MGGQSVLLTFEPHPTRILNPDRAPKRITGADRRLELFAEAGIDLAIVQGFDRDFAAMSPERFARDVLGSLQAKVILVGENFHFGKDRAGDGVVLRALGESLGFRTEIVAPVNEGDWMISSTGVRDSLAQGQLSRVRAMLGRHFDFDGRVVQGDQRARTLGFATANLRTDVEALPQDGVYAVRAKILTAVDTEQKEQWFTGVMNIGHRPTFHAGRAIEVHLIDRQLQLYGHLLRVQCIARLRDEQKFASVPALVAQIKVDVAQARASVEQM